MTDDRIIQLHPEDDASRRARLARAGVMDSMTNKVAAANLAYTKAETALARSLAGLALAEQRRHDSAAAWAKAGWFAFGLVLGALFL